MLEKIERLVNIVKSALWYIVAPIGALVALYFLQKSKRDYNTVQDKNDKQLVTDQIKTQESKYVADNAEDKYNRIRDQYLSEHSSSPNKSDSFPHS